MSNDAAEDSARFECWGVVMPDGGVAVKLKELALFLEYQNVKHAYALVPEEWKITWNELNNKMVRRADHLVAPSTTPANWQPETLFVLEPGVYALMARSNKPMAKEKMKYVYETILPTIRKTGRFEVNNRNEVVNYEAELAKIKIQLLEEQMGRQKTIAECNAKIAIYDAKIAEANIARERTAVVYDAKMAEAQLAHQRQLAEYKEREYQMKLQIQQLTGVAEMTMTQFAVNALLARDNIEENQQMRQTFNDISGRVVPPMTEHPQKMEYIAGYERTTAEGKRRIRVTRTQLNEVQQCDRVIEQYQSADEPASKSKRYAWLRGSNRFLLAQCPNPVALWVSSGRKNRTPCTA
ncbi:BRO [Orgyia pseudotsugata single capsid nuclopolyhedrovirus]|nr:BRO [Orgyia pseudotsugata single capsid nuclopolyhedrovirus]